jgi:hypothetical protein
MISRLNGKLVFCVALAGLLTSYSTRAQGQENPNMIAPGYVVVPQVTTPVNLPFTDAPVPSQIVSAKRVFVANLTGNVMTGLSGGPDRSYNQFYAALKTWGKFKLTSMPADADLVLEIRMVILRRIPEDRPPNLTALRLTIRDPKTNVALWRLDQPIEPAVWEKNQEKNYNLAMTALLNRLKALTEAPGTQAGGPAGTALSNSESASLPQSAVQERGATN